MSSVAAADPFTGIGNMLSHPFFQHAYLAGTLIALAAGMVGYFVVLRRQVFTGDALSHVAFTAALAALAAGIDLRIGLFAGCVLFAVAMAGLGTRGRADDVVIGSAFAWVLGLGVLFLTLYTTSRSASDTGSGGRAGINVLFGSIFGLSAAQAGVAALIGAGVVLTLLGIARPLLFASVDEAVAAARGVPVRALGALFLALVGVTAAEATQAVGSLLLLGLLAAPAGAAHALSTRPYRALWLAGLLAVGSMWLGLAISYAAPSLPPSFAVMSVATAVYAAAQLLRVRRQPRVEATSAAR